MVDEISHDGEKMAPAEAVVKDLPKETLDFFNGDEIRARVFYEKYASKDAEGKTVEKVPAEMWERVAGGIAAMETDEVKRQDWKEKFLWLMSDFRFIPGGRIMFGVGQQRKTTLLNCFVLPIKEDSLESIWDFCKEAARTYSLGGGVGTDISILRPKGAPVNNAAISSSGAVSFMEIMSETTHVIGQNGRRGAMMITMSVEHPDVLEFIRVKQNLNKVKYANISVRITDEFMRAVESDSEFTQRFQSSKANMERNVKAKEIWTELVKAARDWAEPGVLFWDAVTRGSTSEYNGMGVTGTNPCLAGSTFLQTEHGLSQIGELEQMKNFAVADTGEAAVAEKVWITGEKDIYRVRTSLGYYLDATQNHLIKSSPCMEVSHAERRILTALKEGSYKSAKQIRIESGFRHEQSIYKLFKSLKQKGYVETKFVYERNSPKLIRRLYVRATAKAASFKEYEWNAVGSLKVGDRLLMAAKEGIFPRTYVPLPEFVQSKPQGNSKVFSFPKVIDESIGGLLGWIVSDGSATSSRKPELKAGCEYRIRIISLDDEEDEDIKRLIKASLGSEARCESWRKRARVKDWEIGGQNLKDFIDYFGVGITHDKINVPVQIRKSPKPVVAAFLKRVFEGDGTCADRCVTFDSTSYDLALTIQQLLLKFGIIAQLRTTKRTAPRNDIHVLTIRDIASLERYAKEIGFVSTQKQTALELVIKRKVANSSHKNDSNKYDWTDETHIETPITGIEYLGKQMVYDCTTSSHSFVANGFIVHNCSEEPLEPYGACDLGNLNLPHSSSIHSRQCEA